MAQLGIFVSVCAARATLNCVVLSYKSLLSKVVYLSPVNNNAIQLNIVKCFVCRFSQAKNYTFDFIYLMFMFMFVHSHWKWRRTFVCHIRFIAVTHHNSTKFCVEMNRRLYASLQAVKLVCISHYFPIFN